MDIQRSWNNNNMFKKLILASILFSANFTAVESNAQAVNCGDLLAPAYDLGSVSVTFQIYLDTLNNPDFIAPTGSRFITANISRSRYVATAPEVIGTIGNHRGSFTVDRIGNFYFVPDNRNLGISFGSNITCFDEDPDTAGIDLLMDATFDGGAYDGHRVFVRVTPR